MGNEVSIVQQNIDFCLHFLTHSMTPTQTATDIAQMLLQIQAIRLSPDEPFTWASGWRSPIYCDNRLTLSYPEVRSYIKQALVGAIQAHFPQAEGIAGVATAGVPQGALVADALGLPFVYVRPKPKDHGAKNLIEGRLVAGQKVVLIEDLISTGGSSLKAAQAVREAGGEVLGMLAIFTYGFELASEQFAQAGIPLVTLSHYDALLEAAIRLEYITTNHRLTLQEWRQSPATWRQ